MKQDISHKQLSRVNFRGTLNKISKYDDVTHAEDILAHAQKRQYGIGLQFPATGNLSSNIRNLKLWAIE
jgi:hypothetical protein